MALILCRNIPGGKSEKSFLRICCLLAERLGVGLIDGGHDTQRLGEKVLSSLAEPHGMFQPWQASCCLHGEAPLTTTMCQPEALRNQRNKQRHDIVP